MFPLLGWELLLSVCLLFRLAVTMALTAAFMTLVGMSGFLAYMLYLGAPAGCGCLFRLGHVPNALELWLGLVRNAVLIAIVTIGWRSQEHQRTQRRHM